MSDVGMRRAINQDALAVSVAEDGHTWRCRGHLLMVADGMGAHAAGELASKLAVDTVPHSYHKLHDLPPPAALRQAIREANNAIYAKGQSSSDFQGMGTTCTCLALLPQGALAAHVGDSRAYRLRQGRIEQLTFDHSLVWEMAAAAETPEAEIPAFIPKNVITRSLGPHPAVNIDLEGPYKIEPGDVFLVCSDGLSGQVDDEELGTILSCLPPEDAAQTLVDLANLRGGPDNISLVVARVTDQRLPESEKPAECPAPVHTPTVYHPPVHPVLWATMAVSGLLLVLFAWWQMELGMVAAGAGLLTAAIIAAVHHWTPRPLMIEHPSLGGPYGNGPYRASDCQPGPQVAERLANLVDQLSDLESSDEWSIDWTPLGRHKANALSAIDAKDYHKAIVEFTLAIRTTMQQLREQRATVSTDSGINLGID